VRGAKRSPWIDRDISPTSDRGRQIPAYGVIVKGVKGADVTLTTVDVAMANAVKKRKAARTSGREAGHDAALR